MLLQNTFSGLCFVVSLLQLIKPKRSIIWLALYKKIKQDITHIAVNLENQQQQSPSVAAALIDRKQGQTFRIELKKKIGVFSLREDTTDLLEENVF